MPIDTILTIRCPHCMAGTEFRPMIAYEDGRFVCRDCAHTVRPGVPEYRCTCRPCLRLSRKTPLTGRGMDFSTSDSHPARAIILINNLCAPGKVGFPAEPRQEHAQYGAIPRRHANVGAYNPQKPIRLRSLTLWYQLLPGFPDFGTEKHA